MRHPIDTPDDSDTYGVPDTYGVSDAKGSPSHTAACRIDRGAHESQLRSGRPGATRESTRTAGQPPTVPPKCHVHYLRFHSLNTDSIYVFKRHSRHELVDVRPPPLPATSSPGPPSRPTATRVTRSATPGGFDACGLGFLRQPMVSAEFETAVTPQTLFSELHVTDM